MNDRILILLLTFLSLSLPTFVLGQATGCSIGENLGNLLASFTNAASYATVDYFELTGTFTVATGGSCPTSFRAYQTIEAAPSQSCFAAPVEVIVGNGTNVETVTYIYEGCPVPTESLSSTITVNESYWIQTDSEGGSIFGGTSSIVIISPPATSSAMPATGTTNPSASLLASPGAMVTSTTINHVDTSTKTVSADFVVTSQPPTSTITTIVTGGLSTASAPLPVQTGGAESSRVVRTTLSAFGLAFVICMILII